MPYTPFDYEKWLEDECPDWKSGDIIHMKDGTKLLVGDVNQRGGRCDCCRIAVGDIAGTEATLSPTTAP